MLTKANLARVVFVIASFLLGWSATVVGSTLAVRPTSGAFSFGGTLPCGTGIQAPIAVMARAVPGRAVLGSTSIHVVDAGVGDPSLKLLYGASPRGPLDVDPGALPDAGSILASGRLVALPADAGLASCHYRLADNPTAKQIADAATATMVAKGLLSQAELADAGTTFLLSDDPTDSTRLLFFVVLRAPEQPLPVKTVGAEVARSTHAVESVGSGNIYAADSR